ncbi:MAG TPA: hypothetical protein VFJ16_09385 [Longimicrobium sp.]|nr:hypothetical protein [Longimicrobium sp.]
MFLVSAVPALAQKTDSSLVPRARMQAFLRSIEGGDLEEILGYFPRQGEWAWVQTWFDEYDHRLPRTGAWRFPASSTRKVLDRGGPACSSFDRFLEGGEFGTHPGWLTAQVHDAPRGWRRVRRNRFVPPANPANSSVYVEWRREAGAWVVSSFGDEQVYFPNLAGSVVSTVMPDTSLRLPIPEAYLTNESWYVKNENITFEGHLYTKYGTTRSVESQQLTRIGRAGRVAAYVSREDPNVHDVIYFPVGPGLYQAYQGFIPPGCR